MRCKGATTVTSPDPDSARVDPACADSARIGYQNKAPRQAESARYVRNWSQRVHPRHLFAVAAHSMMSRFLDELQAFD
jgi:hypothetical protein